MRVEADRVASLGGGSGRADLGEDFFVVAFVDAHDAEGGLPEGCGHSYLRNISHFRGEGLTKRTITPAASGKSYRRKPQV